MHQIYKWCEESQLKLDQTLQTSEFDVHQDPTQLNLGPGSLDLTESVIG